MANRNAADCAELEISETADQLSHPALQLIAGQPTLFARKGTVVATWRRRGASQKSSAPTTPSSTVTGAVNVPTYLGRAIALVEQVRRALRALRHPVAQFRLLDRLRRQTRAALRVQKLRTARAVAFLGTAVERF